MLIEQGLCVRMPYLTSNQKACESKAMPCGQSPLQLGMPDLFYTVDKAFSIKQKPFLYVVSLS